MMAVEYYRMVLMDTRKRKEKNGYWKETNVQCTVVMVTSGRFWVSDVIRRSQNVKLFELYDVWRAEEIAIDNGIALVVQFFVSQVDPPSHSLFVTQSLDALRSKLVTKGKEKKTMHRLHSSTAPSNLTSRAALMS